MPVLPEQMVKFSIYLKQSNVAQLESLFWEVSNPLSTEYGKYLSMEQITDIVAPSDESITDVIKWLNEKSVNNIRLVQNKDVMVVSAPASTVEDMFNIKLEVFYHKKSGKSIVRANTMYTLPSHLYDEVDFVLGLSNFPKIDHNKHSSALTRAMAEEEVEGLQFLFVQGLDEKFIINFIPGCLNANTSSTIPPCSDYPPAITTFVAQAIAISDAVNLTFTYEGMAECMVMSGVTMCSITLGVTNYNLFNISIQIEYGDGNWSDIYTYAYPMMASPALTPSAIKSYYNIPTDQRVTQPNVTQAVGEFEQQYYDEADLMLFFEEMGLPSDTPVTVVGPNNQSNPGVEANLDIQYIMGIGVGAPTTFWSIYANSSIEIDDILSWAVAMSNTTNPPIVNSLSYGMTEMAVDLFLGPGYLNRSDIEFQKLALRGITIIIADGDAGAGDLGPPPMSANTCKPLHADWPSQSPFVTAVSATMFTPLDLPICYLPVEEGGIDCGDSPLGEVPTGVNYGTPWTTGGGFSNTSLQPSYQADFVKQYLLTLNEYGMLPPPGYFNILGRAYPDVSMVGHNLLIAQGGDFMTVDGTSASAPVFAGFVSLLNDIRVQAGKPLLGFLNPILYQIARDYPGAYNDVVVGNNRCGDIGFQPTCCPWGYEAVPGFDAVSGLGSPDFAVFSNVILNY